MLTDSQNPMKQGGHMDNSRTVLRTGHYLDLAAAARELLPTLKSAESRASLLLIASQYELLARHARQFDRTLEPWNEKT
jgi:hypothetical protein